MTIQKLSIPVYICYIRILLSIWFCSLHIRDFHASCYSSPGTAVAYSFKPDTVLGVVICVDSMGCKVQFCTMVKSYASTTQIITVPERLGLLNGARSLSGGYCYDLP